MKINIILLCAIFSSNLWANAYHCSSSKAFNSHWKIVKNKPMTMRSFSLKACDPDEDLPLEEKIKYCKNLFSQSMNLKNVLSSMTPAEQKALLKASRSQLLKLLFSSKKIMVKESKDTRYSGAMGHPDLEANNIVYTFGLLSEEELKPMITDIKNDEYAVTTFYRTDGLPISMDHEFIKKLTKNFDQNKHKYQVNMNGQVFYALSTYYLEQAQEAIKIAKSIRPDIDFTKLSYLDSHFWLSPGIWDDESDARIEKMEALSKIQGDPMYTVVIDHSNEVNPILYLLATDDLGKTKVVQTKQMIDGYFQVSIGNSFNYKELHTKYATKLDIQCSLK